MKLQWIKNDAEQSILPGFKLRIELSSTYLVLPIINSTSSHLLCIVPQFIPSDFISNPVLIGKPFDPPIQDQFAIIRKEFFFERLYWLIFYKKNFQYVSILELPEITPFQQQPSHFLQTDPLLPQEIATLSFLEDHGVFIRLIGQSPGCIDNLEEFISRKLPADYYYCEMK